MKTEINPLDICLVGGIATVFSFPFASFLYRHGIKYSNICKLKTQLWHPDTRIYQGPLNNKHDKFIIQRIVKSIDVEESNYYGGIMNTGSFYSPAMMSEYRDIVNKTIRTTMKINRFDELKCTTKYNDDTLNANFHYWLKWDHESFNDNGNYCFETSSIYPGNDKVYTVVYRPMKNHIEYIGICDGNISDMENNIKWDGRYSLSIIIANSLPLTYIWWKAIITIGCV